MTDTIVSNTESALPPAPAHSILLCFTMRDVCLSSNQSNTESNLIKISKIPLYPSTFMQLLLLDLQFCLIIRSHYGDDCSVGHQTEQEYLIEQSQGCCWSSEAFKDGSKGGASCQNTELSLVTHQLSLACLGLGLYVSRTILCTFSRRNHCSENTEI